MSNPLNKVVIVNPYCHEGKGWKRWLRIRDEVNQKLSVPVKEVVIEKGLSLEEVFSALHDLSANTCIISAGGDGTIHFLVNYLLAYKQKQLESISVGAIGLGSSNDFLKPFGEKIRGIPVRISCDSGSSMHDVGVVSYSNNKSREYKKYFIVNASFGVTAEANWKFNHPDLFLKFLKKYFSEAAIGYTAISTILKYRNTQGTLSYGNKKFLTSISNINILKIPYVSGSFHYKQSITRSDGNLGLNVCFNMSPWELISVLGRLKNGSFPASSKTLSEFIQEFHFTASNPFVFECDGETEKTDTISISIMPHALKVLNC